MFFQLMVLISLSNSALCCVSGHNGSAGNARPEGEEICCSNLYTCLMPIRNIRKYIYVIFVQGEMGPKGESGIPGSRGPTGQPGKRGKQVRNTPGHQ